MEYVPRGIGPRLAEYLETFPAVMIWGPRQCGKSTFVARELSGFEHFDLERPADISLVSADPELFLADHGARVCIDEAHRLPELFPVLRHVIDKDRRNGRFVLLGSSGPLLLRNLSETLTGRIGIIELRPFSAQELSGRFSWQTRWWRGGLPPLYDLDTDARRAMWLDSYIQTVLERDLPSLGIRVPAVRLYRFWSMLTSLHGQLLNASLLSRSLELSTSAISNYLDIFEGALLIRRLQPYHANIKKRLVKSPKIYIRDSGILHRLAGLPDESSLERWVHRGSSYEGIVIEELTAAAANRLIGPEFFFYRTQAGAEVDLLIKQGTEIWPIEIKLGIEVGHYDTVGLRHCMEDLGLDRGFIVTRGETRAMGRGIVALSWEDICSGSRYPWTYDR